MRGMLDDTGDDGALQDKSSLKEKKKKTIAIGCWKGKVSLNVMVSPLDCQEMLQWLFQGTD